MQKKVKKKKLEKNTMKKGNVTIKEGTISFWLKAEEINLAEGKNVRFGLAHLEDGTIEIYKDKNQKLTVDFSVKGTGKTQLSHDVSNAKPQDRHMVALTWNQSDNEITLYFDGDERDKSEFPK